MFVSAVLVIPKILCADVLHKLVFTEQAELAHHVPGALKASDRLAYFALSETWGIELFVSTLSVGVWVGRFLPYLGYPRTKRGQGDDEEVYLQLILSEGSILYFEEEGFCPLKDLCQRCVVVSCHGGIGGCEERKSGGQLVSLQSGSTRKARPGGLQGVLSTCGS